MLILTSMYGKLKIVRISLTPKFLPQPYIGSGTIVRGKPAVRSPNGGILRPPSPPRSGEAPPDPPGVPYEEAVYPR